MEFVDVKILGRKETQNSLQLGKYKDILWQGKVLSGTISEENLGNYELKCEIESLKPLDYKEMFYIACPQFTKFAEFTHHGNVPEVFYITQISERFEDGKYTYTIVAPSVYFLTQYKLWGKYNSSLPDVVVNCPISLGTWHWAQLFLDNNTKPQTLTNRFQFNPEFILTWRGYNIISSATAPESLTQYEATDTGLYDIYSQVPLSETLTGNRSIFDVFYREIVERSNFNINIANRGNLQELLTEGSSFSLALGIDIKSRTKEYDRTSQYNTIIYNIPAREDNPHVVEEDNMVSYITDSSPFELGFNAKESTPLSDTEVYKTNGYYSITGDVHQAWDLYTKNFLTKNHSVQETITYETTKNNRILSDICPLNRYGIVYNPKNKDEIDYVYINSYEYDIKENYYSSLGLTSLSKGIV